MGSPSVGEGSGSAGGWDPRDDSSHCRMWHIDPGALAITLLRPSRDKNMTKTTGFAHQYCCKMKHLNGAQKLSEAQMFQLKRAGRTTGVLVILLVMGTGSCKTESLLTGSGTTEKARRQVYYLTSTELYLNGVLQGRSTCSKSGLTVTCSFSNSPGGSTTARYDSNGNVVESVFQFSGTTSRSVNAYASLF